MTPQTRLETTYPSSKDSSATDTSTEILDEWDTKTAHLSAAWTPEQRYSFYIKKGIPAEFIPPLERDVLTRIEQLLPASMTHDRFKILRSELFKDLHESYDVALRKSIVDYILLDEQEQRRLQIPFKSSLYIPRISRAPVPWHDSIRETRKLISDNLFVTNPMMLSVLKIFAEYEDCRLFDMSVFTEANTPMSTDEFQSIIRTQRIAFKTKLTTE